MADELEQLDELERPRIGRPELQAIPPLNLRGITPPQLSASAAPAMTERTPIGGSSTMPPPAKIPPTPSMGAAQPNALALRRAGDEAELERLNRTGSGISQIKNRGARGILRGLETIGGMVLPGLVSRIPGTELHHQVLMGQQRRALGQDIGVQEKEAQAAEQQARAEAAANPQGKEKAAGSTVETGEGIFQWNPETERYDIRVGPGKIKQPVEGELPLGERVPQLNQMLGARYQVLHPNQPLPPQYTIPDKATQKDYDRIDKALEAEERAVGTKAQQDTLNEIRRQTQELAKGTRNEGRADRSYNTHVKLIDELAKPIRERAERISRIEDTLAQQNPQSDALVAPELLTIMAGGQGSGLRMNEAEIARIVGGRSVWENLKASVQHWRTDPDAARSITPDQDRQIRALFGAVQDRITKKMQAIRKASGGIASSDDPAEHKRIYGDLQAELSDIDSAKAGSSKDFGPAPEGKADGATGKLPDGTKVVVKGGRLVAQ